MTKLIIAGSAFAAMACTSLPPDSEVPPADGGGPVCREQGLEDLVGREPTQALGQEALRRSGARSLRWIRPGDMVTMDYRTDRLNIHIDARHRVERFNCG